MICHQLSVALCVLLSSAVLITLSGRDVTRLGLGGTKPPPKDVAAPQTGTVIGLFLHGCFAHHVAVG